MMEHPDTACMRYFRGEKVWSHLCGGMPTVSSSAVQAEAFEFPMYNVVPVLSVTFVALCRDGESIFKSPTL